MRRALMQAVLVTLLVSGVGAGDNPPDIAGQSATSLHGFVDKPVTARGRFSMRGKVAPFVDTGKVQIYLMPSLGRDFHWPPEGKHVIVVGTLHYQLEKPSADASKAGVQAYFYLGGDCAFLNSEVL